MSLNGTGNLTPMGNGNGQAVGSNLAFTKFLFVTPRRLDDAARTRLRAAGGLIARGFFNDFDFEGTAGRETQPFETIQFLLQEGELPDETAGHAGAWLPGARYVVQVSSKYRPRLVEIEQELRRRLADGAEIAAIDGAVRQPRYSSAEMQHFIQRTAPPRRSGRVSCNAIILPMRKQRDWWDQSPLERHAYFYPHMDRHSGGMARGHAHAAEAGLPLLFRKVYHNPDGYQRPGEFDFITYFECSDDALPVFDHVCASLRDVSQNPEWRFVEEGPIWRGKRVLRW
jgi:hypothetical protein